MSTKELKWPVRGLEHISLRPGAVVVLAAPRRTGKTTFAQDLALHWARIGHRVVLAPTESEFARRLVQQGYPAAAVEAAGRNLLICDAHRVDIDALYAAATMIDADAIIVDELQFLRYGKPHETISEMALRLGCVVVATCGRSAMIDTIVDATAHIRVAQMPRIGTGVR